MSNQRDPFYGVTGPVGHGEGVAGELRARLCSWTPTPRSFMKRDP